MTIWRVGDFVRFAHQAQSGPNFRISAVIQKPGKPTMVELDGLSGQFATHIFVSAPSNRGDAQDAAAGER